MAPRAPLPKQVLLNDWAIKNNLLSENYKPEDVVKLVRWFKTNIGTVRRIRKDFYVITCNDYNWKFEQYLIQQNAQFLEKQQRAKALALENKAIKMYQEQAATYMAANPTRQISISSPKDIRANKNLNCEFLFILNNIRQQEGLPAIYPTARPAILKLQDMQNVLAPGDNVFSFVRPSASGAPLPTPTARPTPGAPTPVVMPAVPAAPAPAPTPAVPAVPAPAPTPATPTPAGPPPVEAVKKRARKSTDSSGS